jgi:NADH-quinone oxidoreductase subunit C
LSSGDDTPSHDEQRSSIVDRLRDRLGEAVVAVEVLPGRDVWVRVTRDAWADAARVCREELGFSYFCFLSAIDWMPSPYGKSEDDFNPDLASARAQSGVENLEHGVTGGDTRFQLLARVESPVTHLGLTLKADVPDDDLSAPTWSKTYAGANWHEREAWEMFGITFTGHPNLVHIYLPGEFEGYPLRKDFPLLSRMVKPWPGLVDVEPMPGEEESDEEGADTEAAE